MQIDLPRKHHSSVCVGAGIAQCSLGRSSSSTKAVELQFHLSWRLESAKFNNNYFLVAITLIDDERLILVHINMKFKFLPGIN